MDIKTSLKTVLKRLKLSGVLATLPDRVAYARKMKLPEEDFLELVLQDEIDRRDQTNLQMRLRRACFTEEQTLENFDWDAPVTFDRNRVRDLFGLGFLDRKQDVLFMGPVGVGKTFLASALGLHLPEIPWRVTVSLVHWPRSRRRACSPARPAPRPRRSSRSRAAC